MTRISDDLVVSAWRHYQELAHESYVVTPSVPILYFGDSRRYFKSPLRVITVGLNPSGLEFPDYDRFKRFPRARCLSSDSDLQALRSDYLGSLDDYFREEPYKAWFNQAFEPMLQGLDGSFYAGRSNTVLHTDLCSPLATNPTWSKLGIHQFALQSPGVALWHELLNDLEPDLVILSIARHHLSRIKFPLVEPWRSVYRLERKNPYDVGIARVQLDSGKRSLMAFGRAAQLPFSTISHSEKERVGQHLKEALLGR